MTGGMLGLRTFRSDLFKRRHGGMEQETPGKKTIVHARGSHRAAILVDSAKRIYKEIERAERNQPGLRSKLKSVLKNKATRVSGHRAHKKVAMIMAKWEKRRAPNKIERERGIDLPALVLGKIPYSSCNKKKYVDNVIRELEERKKVRPQLEFDPSVNVKALVDILKKDEMQFINESHEKKFCPLTDILEEIEEEDTEDED